MRFVNITPHSITILYADGVDVILPPSGQLARITVKTVEAGEVVGVPLRRAVYGEPEGVPAPQEGVVFVASTLVAQALRRPDVVSPDTGPTAVRKDGQVVAVRGLQAFA